MAVADGAEEERTRTTIEKIARFCRTAAAKIKQQHHRRAGEEKQTFTGATAAENQRLPLQTRRRSLGNVENKIKKPDDSQTPRRKPGRPPRAATPGTPGRSATMLPRTPSRGRGRGRGRGNTGVGADGGRPNITTATDTGGDWCAIATKEPSKVQPPKTAQNVSELPTQIFSK